MFSGCSKPKDYRVAGAHWLEAEAPERDPVRDVLGYPLSESEFDYLESVLARVEEAAKQHPKVWDAVSSAESPVEAAERNKVWSAAEVLGEDVIAITTKLTFLREFASADEPVEEEMRANLAWLEERLQGEAADPELSEAANYIRAMLGVIEAHQRAGAFELYRDNQARMDAALDRFTSIGDQ